MQPLTMRFKSAKSTTTMFCKQQLHLKNTQSLLMTCFNAYEKQRRAYPESFQSKMAGFLGSATPASGRGGVPIATQLNLQCICVQILSARASEIGRASC